MKQHLQQLVATAVKTLQEQGKISPDIAPTIQIERVRDAQFGDFACNVAMMLAKTVGCKPRDLAQMIIHALPASDLLTDVTIAGPGFINFTLSSAASQAVVADIIKAGKEYGRSDLGKGQRINLEFVSSNPTGPLHVGHGRGAAYGATVANLLNAVGYRAHSEYYVNDAGRQMRALTVSVWLRYLALFDEEISFPEGGYKGDYIVDIAQQLKSDHGESLRRPVTDLFKALPKETEENAQDKIMDVLIERTQAALGEDYDIVFQAALKTMLTDIREDLEAFGVVFDEWFPESRLFETGDLERGIERLREGKHLYERDGATWFNAIEFGDEKDRVVIRENGQPTYFASDIAYHINKYERGFDQIIDIFGADHHGYAPRIKAFLQAEGLDPAKFNVLLVQFATLYRDGEKLSMSTRGGKFVTLRELRDEVGNDAARFFYIMRKNDQHLDFDLALAKSQSADNPVYYIQYAHARVCSVLRQAEEKKLVWDQNQGLKHLDLLEEPQEKTLLRSLSRYAEVVESAATKYEPHLLAHYLQALANDFHTYYNAQQFLVEDDNLRQARLSLIVAAQQVVANGLDLLGVSAPDIM